MNRILLKARKKSNASIRRLHMSSVHSYIMVKLYHICIILMDMLIHSKDIDRRVELKIVTELENLIGRRCWITQDMWTLIHQRYKSKNDYQNCKKECHTLRANHLEEISREISAKVNSK